jgi:predicted Zn-dependent protease
LRGFARTIVGATLLLASLAATGCGEKAETPQPYHHNRWDYWLLRDRFPEILEPNYLPFMAYRVSPYRAVGASGLARRLAGWLGLEVSPDRELLVFCRWEESDFPLRVAIVAPELDEDAGHEFWSKSPAGYVAAVERALAIWERDLEGAVRFRRVEREAEAALVLRIVGEEAPSPEPTVQVLGRASLGDACRVVGGDPDSGRLEVRYNARELKIYVADQHGLLLPDQVERVALHEIGHAIGMRGHSPIPADLMYEVARDRLGPDGLGAEDVNSFLSLYALPNGTVYTSLVPSEGRAADPLALPEGPPRLALAPHVDAGRGFEIQTPMGWLRIATPFGVAAVNGVSWDYDASFQLIVRRYETIESYLERNAAAHFGVAVVTSVRDASVAGHRARRFTLARPNYGFAEEFVFIESGDGRVLISIAECPVESQAAYRPWFDAVLASLEIQDGSTPGEDRDYTSDAADLDSPPSGNP